MATIRLRLDGFSCENCGTTLNKDDEVGVCTDCGAIFCKKCVENNALKNHTCEEDDEI